MSSRPTTARRALPLPASPRDDVDAASTSPARGPRGFRASNRLLARAGQAMGARPYLASSLLLHAAVLGVAATWHPVSEAERTVASREAARATEQVALTASRELERRVERMEEIRRTLGEAAGLPPSAASAPAPTKDGGPSSPQDLLARAQALSREIDDAERALRARTLSRLAGMSMQDAAREVARQDVGSRPPGTPETAAEAIERLERHAQEAMRARRSQVEAAQQGVRVSAATARSTASSPASRPGAAARAGAASDAGLPTTARARAAASAPLAAASEVATPWKGSTAASGPSQSRPADGIPRSSVEQIKSVVRTGEARGRVGVVGVAQGRSVNQEHVLGVEGGQVHRAQEDFSWVPVDPGPAVTAGGGSVDLATPGADGRHDGIRYVAAPALDAAAMRAGAGRTLGPGGLFATRVYLDSWYVIGPFDGRAGDRIDTVYPPEEDVDLDGAYRGLGGRVVTWKYASRGFYPFVPPDAGPGAVYYAWTELRVDQDRDAWFDIGTSGDSKMWLDERLVWVSAPVDKPWYHPPYYLPDQQVASLALVEGHRRVHLTRGVHRLLFKLASDQDRTFFSVVLAP